MLENKIMIYKVLAEVSQSFQPVHQCFLLKKLLNVKTSELHDQDINLAFELMKTTLSVDMTSNVEALIVKGEEEPPFFFKTIIFERCGDCSKQVYTQSLEKFGELIRTTYTREDVKKLVKECV